MNNRNLFLHGTNWVKGTDDKHVNKRSYLETVFGGVLVRICGGKEQLQRNTQQGTTLIVKVPYK